MSSLATISILLFLASCGTGCLGALTGIGGGIILVPLLTLAFGVPLHYAMAASLIAVIAQSMGSAVAFLHGGYTNLRVGIFLETAASIGAVAGAYLTTQVSESTLSILFGLVLLFAAVSTVRKRADTLLDPNPQGWAQKLRLYGSYPSATDTQLHYAARNILGGWMVMSLAGLMSGLLGVGAGAVKVLAMDQIMALPYKVSTTTSNLIVGITAAVGLGIYLNHGYLDAVVATPVVLGIVAGALIGSRVLVKAPIGALRLVFTAVIVFFGCMMLRQGLKSWL